MNKHSVERKKHANCDYCGNVIKSTYRLYKGETYCSNCYRTWFIKKPCSKCGEIKRLHKKEEFSICLACQRKQPCIRCGAGAQKNGTTTQYGRVCNYCSRNYFRELKTCFECSKQAIKLTRCQYASHNHQICQSCYQKYTHASCACCHRYRKVIDTTDGKKCKKCHEIGQIPCPKCQKLMWAGVGKHCWNCYGSDTLQTKINLNQYLFDSPTIKSAYQDFLLWLSNHRSIETANQKHTSFIEFFIYCDKKWSKIPNYETLVSEFKPEGLRHNLTVLRWLIDTNQILINKTLKEHVAEQERIEKLLAKFEGELPVIIQNYYEYLVDRQQKRQTALKTVRLSLQPVVDIYHQFELKIENTPSQTQIDQYLLAKSGQANSLSSFIVFLREKYSIYLHGKPNQIKPNDVLKRKAIEKEILYLAQLPKPLSRANELQWLLLGMMYFHKQSLNIQTLKKLEKTEDNVNEVMILHYKGQEYAIPMC